MPTDNQISEDVLIARIGQLVEAIRSDGSPEELERIKKLIRRNVPFTLRGYFSSYLLRELMKTPQARDGHRERKDVRAERQERKPREVRPERPVREQKAEEPVRREREERRPMQAKPQDKTQQPKEKRMREIPEGARTLYINLGKANHVYARDLISLITAEGTVSKEGIYLIRIHDKYSFITLSEEDCQDVIARLNGTTVKGRLVQVNISNKDRRPGEVVEKASDKAAATATSKQEEAPAGEEATIGQDAPAVEVVSEAPVAEEAPAVEEHIDNEDKLSD